MCEIQKGESKSKEGRGGEVINQEKRQKELKKARGVETNARKGQKVKGQSGEVMSREYGYGRSEWERQEGGKPLVGNKSLK